ncbi:hypothetical protein [Oceaniglobus trochenteri]|uniref:hypothetical protein n=1 Tax=Oceaniglobus trochenteri TaxID=2763260 RepID=UPI001CFF6F46|nr:hypothetical protein [Oceaniglobus trochenteri]
MRHRLKILAACLLFQALGTLAASAQTPTESDLLALRFYMAEGNEQAVESELRRLQLQYPDWTPTEDLTEVARDVPADTIDRLYRMIEAGDYNGVRTLIDSTRQSFPDWSPSEELLQTLAVAEAQTRFTTAVETADADAAIRIARGNPALLRCERVNNAWLLAEQYQSLGEDNSALAVYRSVLRSCDTTDVLLATLEKSAAIADVPTLAEFAGLARTTAPEAAGQITTTENRLRAGMNAAPVAQPLATETAPSEGVDETIDPTLAMISSPKPAPRPADLDTRRPTPAPAPARTAPRASGDSSTPAPASSGQAAARGDWQGCLASARGQSGDALSQRAWCALNAGRPMQALNDFKKATAIGSTARTRRDSAFGMALAMLQLDMVDQAAQVAATTQFDRKQRLDIESQILDKRGVFAFNRGDYAQAIAYFNELERLTGRMRRDLSLLRGYAYLNSGQRPAAVAEFRRVHEQMATPASRRALSEALK